ncbi:formylmethanofuran dehydrogenase [Trinickia sp. LjRoot230]|uniref:formylmethanofuran dehydrogenase n=1 Tax=Trinickia sp. LjRoot230 TaxID=3342288 RepID=UPI003ECF3AFA
MPYSSIDPSNGGAPGALSPDAPSTVRYWTCPFCPLLCDDIALTVDANGTLEATEVSCPRLARALDSYGPNDAHCPASVDALPASFDGALAHAARILAAARRPLFGGLATDVAGTRALYTLAASCGATLDHVHGESMSAATRVMQDRGACFTTLSEVRSRADLLIFFGCRPSERYPRFYTRALGVDGIARELVFVGTEVDPAAKGLPKVLTETMLPQRDALDTVALWSALAEGRPPASLNTLRADGRAAVDVLASLVARIAAARYTVLVYEPAALPGDQAALVIEGLQRIVKAINRTTRAGALALAGDDGALTVNQAVTWLSGLPLPLKVPHVARAARVREAGGISNAAPPLEHDARRLAAARLIADGGIDALLWVASFGPTPWPETLAAEVPVIVIGHPALAEAAVARGPHTVFIPAATPAIDAPGHLFRLDGSVVARLTPARSVGLQSVAEIVERVAEQLAACPGTAQP